MHSDIKKRRSFFALLFAAGDAWCSIKLKLINKNDSSKLSNKYATFIRAGVRQDHLLREASDNLANYFNLTEEEQMEPQIT